MSQLLQEISYSLPTNGPAAFWDFYALNYLWFRLGGGHEEMYGGKFHPGQIPNVRRQEVIEELFERCSRKLLKELTAYLFEAAVKEFHNYVIRSDYRYYTNQELVNKLSAYADEALFAEESYDEYDADKFYKIVGPKMNAFGISLQNIHETFSRIKWEDEYGGKVWSKIIELALEITKKQEGMPLKDVVKYIDIIYDTQHNTGSILNKGKWEVLNTDLDKRHDIRDIKEFLPHVTHVVKALILNSMPYFNRTK